MLINQVKKTTLKQGNKGNQRRNNIVLRRPDFTDVWGANRVGIKSIMVEKINPKEENINCFKKNS